MTKYSIYDVCTHGYDCKGVSLQYPNCQLGRFTSQSLLPTSQINSLSNHDGQVCTQIHFPILAAKRTDSLPILAVERADSLPNPCYQMGIFTSESLLPNGQIHFQIIATKRADSLPNPCHQTGRFTSKSLLPTRQIHFAILATKHFPILNANQADSLPNPNCQPGSFIY